MIVNSSTELKRLQNLYQELRSLKEENKELKELESFQNMLNSKNKKIEFSYLQTERLDKPMSSLTVQTVRYNNTLRNSHDSHRYSKSTERKTNNKK
jgi:HJR/Mrr/RecB family endonuclease